MYREYRNNFLNRISTCYLKSVKVQYGGDRFPAYEETTSLRGSGAPPQRSQISLEFTRKLWTDLLRRHTSGYSTHKIFAV